MKERIDKINALIKTISEEERAFFLNKEGNGLIANFQLKDNKLFYQDEWKGESREITLKTDWVKIGDWVSHGSTIRGQVIQFAKYIFTGQSQKMYSRYWGISFKSQLRIHKKAHELGFLEGDKGFTFYDYTQKMDRHCCDECGEHEAFSRCEKGMRLCPTCEMPHLHYTGHSVMPITKDW